MRNDTDGNPAKCHVITQSITAGPVVDTAICHFLSASALNVLGVVGPLNTIPSPPLIVTDCKRAVYLYAFHTCTV